MHVSAEASPTRQRRTLELVVAALLAFSILSIFWSAQRYPALLKKLHAGNSRLHQGRHLL